MSYRRLSSGARAVYYNDYDRHACAWLRELIAEGLLPAGEVDERSILDVQPADLHGFAQCHFFAGIGGWPYALRLAGISENLPVWTGSPPCQPFSVAGQRKGSADERHLAPAFLRLVAACRPDFIFGEQVASAAALGPAGGSARAKIDGETTWAWFDALADGMEDASYAVAAADLPAASVGAPHIRQRLFFGAVAFGRLDNPHSAGQQGPAGVRSRADQCAFGPTGLAGGLADAPSVQRERYYAGSYGLVCEREAVRSADGETSSKLHRSDYEVRLRPGATDGVWRDADWLLCRDGRWRPVEPGITPLAHGIPDRVGLLRGYGNAIVPQVAAEFVTAFMEAIGEMPDA